MRAFDDLAYAIAYSKGIAKTAQDCRKEGSEMKRDLELIRKIILAAEASPNGFTEDDLGIEGYSEEQIGYHSYLVVDSGLAEGVDLATMDSKSPSWRILHLTSAGHDFANASRNEDTWRKATGIVQKQAGGVSLDIMREVLISVIKNALNL